MSSRELPLVENCPEPVILEPFQHCLSSHVNCHLSEFPLVRFVRINSVNWRKVVDLSYTCESLLVTILRRNFPRLIPALLSKYVVTAPGYVSIEPG